MLDDMREQIGRDRMVKGEFVLSVKFFTNMDRREENKHLNIFDRPVENTRLLELENEELLIKLLLKEPTKQQLRAIFHRYFEERQMKEVGEVMGYSESTISKIIKEGIMKCQEKLKEMELVRL